MSIIMSRPLHSGRSGFAAPSGDSSCHCLQTSPAQKPYGFRHRDKGKDDKWWNMVETWWNLSQLDVLSHLSPFNCWSISTHGTITAQTCPSDALEVHVCSEEICELLVDIWISTLDLLHCVTLPHQILQPEPQQNTKHNWCERAICQKTV